MFLLNGQSADNIDILDRGLHYGDGLFETLAVIDEQPLCWDQHLKRLLSGCERLKIDFNDVDTLESEVTWLCKNRARAVLKVTITSGVGGRAYKRNNTETKPTRLIALHPWPEYSKINLSEGIQVHLCSTRLGHNPTLAGIKHLNRLEQVLARNEWDETNILEGLMLDIDGNIMAGTMSNLFTVYPGKKLRTPDVSSCGIEGIVRQYLLEHCTELGYESEICKLSLDDVYSANEIFFCNSVAGILPVSRLGKAEFSSHFMTTEIQQFLVLRGVIAPS